MLQRLELLAPFGRTVVYGAAGVSLPPYPCRVCSACSMWPGSAWPAWRPARPEQARAEMREPAGHAAGGRLRTVVHATLPRTEAAKAHQLLDDRAQLGRVLIVP